MQDFSLTHTRLMGPRRSRRRLVAVFVLILPCLAGTLESQGQDSWTSFQNGGALEFSAEDAPAEWSPGDGIAWMAQIEGYGQSSPVVWEDHVYVTSVSGEMKQNYHVTAFRASDGEPVWQYNVTNPSPVANNQYVSRAAPTPAVDDAGVIVFFEGGNLLALSHEGELRWKRDLVEDYGPIETQFGLGGSVEQNEDKAFIWVERDTDPYLLAVQKSDGETAWKVAGAGATSWSTPRLIPVSDSQQHLVASAEGLLLGLDPASGEILWKMEGLTGNTVTTPVPVGLGKFIIGASEGRDGSGFGSAAESNGVVEIVREDGEWQPRFAWRSRRATSSFASPIVHQDRAYLINRAGVVHCFNAVTGEALFSERLEDSAWATPLAAGDRVYVFGQNGLCSILEASDSFSLVSTCSVWPESERTGERFGGPVLYGVALADGTLFVRRGDRLYAVSGE